MIPLTLVKTLILLRSSYLLETEDLAVEGERCMKYVLLTPNTGVDGTPTSTVS